MVCSLSLCVFTTEALTRIVILRDFWNCNWPGWLTCQFLQLPSCVEFCLQRPTFNFLSHLLRWGTLHGIYTKAAGKQMQMKKPHWNKGRCLVKDKAKIILPANYLLPLASMCLGCNTIPLHPWILKHYKAYDLYQLACLWMAIQRWVDKRNGRQNTYMKISYIL